MTYVIAAHLYIHGRGRLFANRLADVSIRHIGGIAGLNSRNAPLFLKEGVQNTAPVVCDRPRMA